VQPLSRIWLTVAKTAGLNAYLADHAENERRSPLQIYSVPSVYSADIHHVLDLP
jgi:hypothetical protein